SKIVEQYAMYFDRPEDRLRFLNNTIIRQKKRQEDLHYSLRYFRFLKNTRFYDWILEGRLSHSILEELMTLAKQLPPNRQAPLLKIEVPLSARLFFFMREARHAIYATGLIMAGVVLVGLYSAVIWGVGTVHAWWDKDHPKKTPNSPIAIGRDTKPTPAATPTV